MDRNTWIGIWIVSGFIVGTLVLWLFFRWLHFYLSDRSEKYAKSAFAVWVFDNWVDSTTEHTDDTT